MMERKGLYVALHSFAILATLCCLGMQSDRRFSKTDFARLDVLLGKWKMVKGTSVVYEEWKKDNSKQLKGLSYKVTGWDTTYLETVRLFYHKHKIFYAPTAYGQNKDMEVQFELVDLKGSEFKFENVKHDFPQRIVYEPIGQDSVHAYIEGTMNGKSHRSDYHFSKIK